MPIDKAKRCKRCGHAAGHWMGRGEDLGVCSHPGCCCANYEPDEAGPRGAIDKAKIEEFRSAAKMAALPNATGGHLALSRAIDALLSEREEMLALLREVEWVLEENGPDGAKRGKHAGKGKYWPKFTSKCPLCRRSKPEHAPDCRLAALLK